MKAAAGGRGFPRKRNGQRAGSEWRRGWVWSLGTRPGKNHLRSHFPSKNHLVPWPAFSWTWEGERQVYRKERGMKGIVGYTLGLLSYLKFRLRRFSQLFLLLVTSNWELRLFCTTEGFTCDDFLIRLFSWKMRCCGMLRQAYHCI
jgi:hypothetical protein